MPVIFPDFISLKIRMLSFNGPIYIFIEEKMPFLQNYILFCRNKA